MIIPILLATLFSQIELEIPKDVSIGDRITIKVTGDYENYVWNVKRINLDGEKLHLEDIEKGALRVNVESPNQVDFTTKIPGSYRFFVSASNEQEVVQTIGQLNLDYDNEFVNRKPEFAYEPVVQKIRDEIPELAPDPGSIEEQIQIWTKEVPNYNRQKMRIGMWFIEESEKLARNEVQAGKTLKNLYAKARRELPPEEFSNWAPWFHHINDLCQDYGAHKEIKDNSDWIPILSGIGEEVMSVR